MKERAYVTKFIGSNGRNYSFLLPHKNKQSAKDYFTGKSWCKFVREIKFIGWRNFNLLIK